MALGLDLGQRMDWGEKLGQKVGLELYQGLQFGAGATPGAEDGPVAKTGTEYLPGA